MSYHPYARPIAKLILLVLPLGLDTFAVSAALGLRGAPPSERLRASVLMSSFEMAMPLVGLAAGLGIGRVIGDVADYVAIAALAGLGIWMLLTDDDDQRVESLQGRGWLALVTLGISISLDELALGFTIGLLDLPLVPAIALIGLQAFVFAQLGLRLGSRLGEAARESTETLAALALLA